MFFFLSFHFLSSLSDGLQLGHRLVVGKERLFCELPTKVGHHEPLNKRHWVALAQQVGQLCHRRLCTKREKKRKERKERKEKKEKKRKKEEGCIKRGRCCCSQRRRVLSFCCCCRCLLSPFWSLRPMTTLSFCPFSFLWWIARASPTILLHLDLDRSAALCWWWLQNCCSCLLNRWMTMTTLPIDRAHRLTGAAEMDLNSLWATTTKNPGWGAADAWQQANQSWRWAWPLSYSSRSHSLCHQLHPRLPFWGSLTSSFQTSPWSCASMALRPLYPYLHTPP